MTAAYGKWQWGKGAYSAPINLAGNVSSDVKFFGSFGIIVAGNLSPQVELLCIGGLAGTMTMAGNFPVNVTLAASAMRAGPLWDSDEPCASVDWKESTLCNG